MQEQSSGRAERRNAEPQEPRQCPSFAGRQQRRDSDGQVSGGMSAVGLLPRPVDDRRRVCSAVQGAISPLSARYCTVIARGSHTHGPWPMAA
jgi:hypothetical protein